MKRYGDAASAYDSALRINLELPEAWLGRGNICIELKQYDAASAAFDKALTLAPHSAKAWLGRGNLLTARRRYDEALAAYDKALSLQPDLAAAWLGRGGLMSEFRRYDEAVAAYDKALAITPGLAEAWLGRGNVSWHRNRRDDALAEFDKALALKPDLGEAWLSRGNVLTELNRFQEAFAAFDKALTVNPDLRYAAGLRLFSKLLICDWSNREAEVAQLLSAVRAGKPASAPFPVVAISEASSDQWQCATRGVSDQQAYPPIWRGEIYPHERIRVAYLSADFREHPMGYLTIGLLENHDRSRFETTAIALGADEVSDTRDKVKRAVEHFIDADTMSDQDIAELIRRREIDVVVDLMGFTVNNRLDALARRPAPVQVNYLGYPGTTGADYVDYIIADQTTIPQDQCRYYSEQVVWLPGCYQVNDNKRRVAEPRLTRAKCGLPEQAFVFCSFNNTFKFTPAMFDIWMRLLDAIPDSVLWLFEGNSPVSAKLCRDNLSAEAEKRGVSARRLVFAPRVDVADHLARQRNADLFLDTLPYNAHTTASDALWVGLPLVTCLGATFAGRVAASLLQAVGLDELVTHSLADYEALALKLAREPATLAAIRAKLLRNRDTSSLFDSAKVTRQIEAAYTAMWDRYRRGERPQARADGSKPIIIPR